MQQQSLSSDSQTKTNNLTPGVRLGRIVFGLSAIAVCTKAFGFAEKLVVAHFFGTGDTADVYFASTAMLLSIVFFVKELLYPSLLPVFADSLSESPSSSASLFKKMFYLTTCFLFIVAAIIIAFPGFITNILVPGFPESKQQMTYSLLRLLTPAALFLSLTMVTYTVLNAHRRFFTAAWPEAVYKLFIVAGLVVLLPVLGIHALAVVMGLGGLGCLLVQLYFIPEHKVFFRQQNSAQNTKLIRKVLLLMGPLVVGVIFSHISGLVDNVLASTLPSGHLSYLGYSKKLIDAILLIGPVALVTVVFSHLSHLASAKDYKKLTLLVAKAFRILTYLSVPAACLLIGLRQPIIRCLFQRGQFNADSTFGTSQAFMVYAFGLVTFSLEPLLVYSFFALSDTKTPVKFGILCAILDIVLAVLLLKPLGYAGIAGAFIISKTVKVLILTFKISKRLTGLFDLSILTFLVKLAVSTGAAWATLGWLFRVEIGKPPFSSVVWDLTLTAIGGASVFVLCSYLLKIDELRAVISLLRKREASDGAFLIGENRWNRQK